MEIRSILVNIDVGHPNSPALKYAIDLAGIFDAELTGVAADEPELAYLGVNAGNAAVDYFASQQVQIEQQLSRAEEQFQALVPNAIKRHWRCYTSSPIGAVLECARTTDLIVTAAQVASTFHDAEVVDIGQLVLASGRPVISVAVPAAPANFDNIVIGWKDTREARRAVSDALPFLKKAKDVLAVTVSEGDFPGERASIGDLTRWLSAHGVTVRSDVLTEKEPAGKRIEAVALEHNAGLVVAGGYGHARLREWLFGGATKSLLEAGRLNRLFSN